MKHLVWLVALSACTEFESIDRDVCGNGLLERGEDCDSADPSCVSCSVTCTSDDQCPNSAYHCGVDGLCHAPGGALGQLQSAGAFQADELAITDIDQDGIGDTLGLSRTSLLVRHGDAAGELDQLDSILTPTQTGPAAFGDLDNDGSLDLALTTPDGLVSYSSAFGAIAPVAVAENVFENGQGIDIRMMFYLAPNVFSLFAVDPASGATVLVTVDGNAPKPAQDVERHIAFSAPCAQRIGALNGTLFDPVNVSVYNLMSDPDGRIHAIVAIAAGTGASRRFCLLSVNRDAPNIFNFNNAQFPIITATDITPPGLLPQKRPVLADLETDDGEPCPGVVTWDQGLGAMKYWDGTRASADAPCTFTGTSTTLPSLEYTPTAELVGRVPVDPPMPFVARDGLVTSEAMFPYLPTGVPIFKPVAHFQPVYYTTRKIERVAHGDVDGDGQVDAVLAAAGEADLDVLLRVPQEAGFNLVRLDTAATVTSLLVADFDGNRIKDIAYSEAFDDHQRLMVAFGTPDRPLAPTFAGSYTGIKQVSHLAFPDSVDYLGLADDLVVLQPPLSGETSPRMTLLHGSPQRTLISYFDPRGETFKDNTLFRGSVIGHFVGGSGTQFRDLVALAPPAANAMDTTKKVRSFRVPGTAQGLDITPSNGTEVVGVVDCSLSSASMLCVDNSRYLAFPTELDHDVVIGVDSGRRAIKIDPWLTADPVSAVSLDTLAAKIPEGTAPRSLHAADLDGDGGAELVATFAGSDASAVVVCTMNQGVPSQCDDIVPAIKELASEVTHCNDAAPARIAYRDATQEPAAGIDVVVACRGNGTSLFRVQRTAAGDTIERLATLAANVTALRGGDVTGDGVDDLVMIEGEAVRTLLVYKQCTSRDLACMEASR